MDINQTPLDPSQFGSNVPRRDDPNIAKLAAKYLKMRGWQLVGEVPNVKQLVMLAVPHTSNEDGWNAVMGILSDLAVKPPTLGGGYKATHTL